MGKIVAIANQKGGVGKTTTAINLAASLGILEKKILIIDADPQSNSTTGVGVEPDEVEITTYDIMINNADPLDAIYSTTSPNLDIIPSSIDLVGAELELVSKFRREYVLEKALVSVRDKYDYIFIDCAPSLGLTTINALTAADSVIIPLQCEVYSLEGLGKLKNTISIIKDSLNPDLEIEGILLTMFDKRLRLANIVADEIMQQSPDPVFDTVINRNSKLAEAPNMRLPVALYDATAVGTINYLQLANEFLNNNNDTIYKQENKESIA